MISISLCELCEVGFQVCPLALFADHCDAELLQVREFHWPAGFIEPFFGGHAQLAPGAAKY